MKKSIILVAVLSCFVLVGCSQNVPNGSFNGISVNGYNKADANWTFKTEKDGTSFLRNDGLTFKWQRKVEPIVMTDAENTISIFSNDDLTFRIFNSNQEELISKIESSSSVFEDGDVKYYTTDGSDYAIIVWKDKMLYMSITLENDKFSSDNIEEYAKEFQWNV